VTRELSFAEQQLLESGAPAVARCADAWNEPNLPARLTLVVGQRLSRSLGRCHPERGLVQIARFALELSAELRDEIICHEAAHLVVFERHGRSGRPHGSEWKALMRSVGLAPRVRIQLAATDAARTVRAAAPRVFFEHRCPVCQLARLARRRMSQWRCRACVGAGRSGRLEVSRSAGSELRF
jgi:predicted SprT family Zn-dependent metalloprotease